MFESSKFDKSGHKSGGHIRSGPDLKKNGRIPAGAGAGAGYGIRCNASMDTITQFAILYPCMLCLDYLHVQTISQHLTLK